jgi:5,10-methylenetetrahydromethanopterin reductase
VKSIVGPHAMIMLHKLAEQQSGAMPRPLPAEAAASGRALYGDLAGLPARGRALPVNHRGHLMYLRPEEQQVCTGDLIHSTTMTGTRAELRERLQSCRAGFTHVGIETGYRHRGAGGVGSGYSRQSERRRKPGTSPIDRRERRVIL